MITAKTARQLTEMVRQIIELGLSERAHSAISIARTNLRQGVLTEAQGRSHMIYLRGLIIDARSEAAA